MQENFEHRKESNAESWADVAKGVSKMLKENAQASEIINEKARESKAKNLGLICITIISFFLLMGNYNQTQTMYENDKEWRQVVEQNNQRWIDYLSQYDFVSQDGKGDIVNGTESEDTEKSE